MAGGGDGGGGSCTNITTDVVSTLILTSNRNEVREGKRKERSEGKERMRGEGRKGKHYEEETEMEGTRAGKERESNPEIGKLEIGKLKGGRSRLEGSVWMSACFILSRRSTMNVNVYFPSLFAPHVRELQAWAT